MRDQDSEDVAKILDRIANKENNKFMDFINSSEYSKACDLAISVLSLVEERRRSNGSKVSQHVWTLSPYLKCLDHIKSIVMSSRKQRPLTNTALSTQLATMVLL